MQYIVGTVDVTNGDATVTGTDTAFDTEVQQGDWFSIVGSNVWYEIASITDPTHLELSSNYAGDTDTDLNYVILRDFTSPDNIPYPQQGDIETASLLKRAINKIQSLLATDGILNLGSKSTNFNVNWLSSRVQKVTLTGDCQVTFSEDKNYSGLRLYVVQDPTGNRLLTYNNTVKFKGNNSTVSTDPNAVDCIRLDYDLSSDTWYAEIEEDYQ